MNTIQLQADTVSEKQIALAERVLADNGIDNDETDIVLQAIGYILLDTELYPDC